MGPEDFDALVREYSAAVAELANRVLGWPGDVDDVVQEMDAEEICKVLRISRNALYVRLNRARHQLKDLLSGLRDDL